MANIIKFSRGPVVSGTMFRHFNEEMSDASLIGSGEIRPHYVDHVVGNTAFCVPLSSSSDAWNAEVSPHFIPYDLNPRFFNYKNSLYAVNNVELAGKFIECDVKLILQQNRIDLPREFVLMGRQLLSVFHHDRVGGRLIKQRGVRYKNRRISESIKRVGLTTIDIMESVYGITL